MAQTAKPEAGKVSHTAEATREATDRAGDVARQGLEVVQRTTDALGGVQREVAQRSAEHTAELGRVFVDLLQEQTQHNLKTFAALTGAVDWDQVAKAIDWEQLTKIQGEYLRVSLERGAQLARRYLEVSQTVVTATADAAKKQARKAA